MAARCRRTGGMAPPIRRCRQLALVAPGTRTARPPRRVLEQFLRFRRQQCRAGAGASRCPLTSILPAAQFVPQTGAMCLLERIVAADAQSLVATTVLTARQPVLPRRTHRLLGEAWNAWRRRWPHGRASRNAAAAGVRASASCWARAASNAIAPWLPVDQLLRFEVQKEIQLGDALGQFSGKTFFGDELLASGGHHRVRAR